MQDQNVLNMGMPSPRGNSVSVQNFTASNKSSMIGMGKAKYMLDLLTAGGYYYYKLVFPDLIEKPEGGECYNVSSPFRRDRNPSFHIRKNFSTNTWYHQDYGDSSSKGDMFSLAARRYKMDITIDFIQIMYSMLSELGLDKLTIEQYDHYLNILPTDNEILYRYPQFEATKWKYCNTEANPNTQEIIVAEMVYSTEEQLSQAERKFLSDTGISYQTMQKCKAYFIDDYTIYRGDKGKNNKKPKDHVWICYPFNGGYKIYSPNPKKFWWVGSHEGTYIFGTPRIVGKLEKEEIVFLTGGEKDVMTLISRGYNAMCLNSETMSIDKSTAKQWYFDYGYDVVVLYDNDETGIKQANKLEAELGYDHVVLPTGIKDITEYFSNGGTVEGFELLVKDARHTKVEKLEETIVTDTVLVPNETRSTMRTARQRLNDAKAIPDITPYFDVFLHDNECVIFFGDTGIGKSVFAVGLADAISKGYDYMGFTNSHGPVKLLYYDFELTDKQFQKRYTNDQGIEYDFSDNLMVDAINFQDIIPSGKKIKIDEALFDRIEQDIIDCEAQVVIIDNITYLSARTG